VARESSRREFVRKRYWNEPKMGWWERAYLPEILRGLAITSIVFLRNMGKWITGRKGAITTYYPEERRWDYGRRNRGKHVLTQRPDGSPQCIACNMCATVCPAKVIEIDAGFDPDDAAHPKYPARFEIDYSRCVFCGLCVEACPEDAIRMVPDVPDFPSGERRKSMWIGKEELLTWNPQRDVAKPYPPKARSSDAAADPHARSLSRGQSEEKPLSAGERGRGEGAAAATENHR
jgi:NADH-quinone oxidoreductase subunit I